MIRIICLGKIKEKYITDAIEDYQKRIQKYHRIEIIELKDCEDILKEENQLIKYLNTKEFNICLTIEGTQFNSLDLAKLIDNKMASYSNINFFIGSSNGLTDKIKKGSNLCLSFGLPTYPHGLFRVLLLEQIYRSFKIINNESYHK